MAGTPPKSLNTMHKKRNKAETAKLQRQAAKMIIVDGMFQKDVAAKLGVSKNTLSTWAKKFKWNDAAKTAMQTTHYLNIAGFEAYLQARNAEAYQTFKKQLAGYIEANKPVQMVLVG